MNLIVKLPDGIAIEDIKSIARSIDKNYDTVDDVSISEVDMFTKDEIEFLLDIMESSLICDPEDLKEFHKNIYIKLGGII